jgi:hypothetical protein
LHALERRRRRGFRQKVIKRRVDEPVRVVIGAPVPAEEIAALRSDPNALMDHLRARTYGLSPDQISPYDLGYEFEAKYKAR